MAFHSSHFSFLVFGYFWRWNFYNLQGKMGRTEKNGKKTTQLKWPKYQKTNDENMGWMKHNWRKFIVKSKKNLSNITNDLTPLYNCLLVWGLEMSNTIEWRVFHKISSLFYLFTYCLISILTRLLFTRSTPLLVLYLFSISWLWLLSFV